MRKFSILPLFFLQNVDIVNKWYSHNFILSLQKGGLIYAG